MWCHFYLNKKERRNLFIKINNLRNSASPSFNISMFTEEYGTTINNKVRKNNI